MYKVDCLCIGMLGPKAGQKCVITIECDTPAEVQQIRLANVIVPKVGEAYKIEDRVIRTENVTFH